MDNIAGAKVICSNSCLSFNINLCLCITLPGACLPT